MSLHPVPRDVHATGPLMPDVLLPEQHEGSTIRTGERRLQIAVFEEAVANLSRARAEHAFAVLVPEIEAWFASMDRVWPFSFLNLCDALGVDAEATRTRLKIDGKAEMPIALCVCGRPRHKGQCLALRRLEKRRRANRLYRARRRQQEAVG